MSDAPMPFVAVMVPVLDEERCIAGCLESLLGQEPGGGFEILVLDGGSRDATRDIVAAVAARSAVDIRLIDNPGRLQSAACNLGAAQASPEATVLVRADAHAVYPADFLVRCVGALIEHDATSVVVAMRTEAEPQDAGTGLQRAIAATQNSRLGNGGSAHRTAGGSGWVDHGHHAAFDRAFYRALGGYEPGLATNEDAELDVRALRAGGRIWMCREVTVTYFPRRGLRSLARQYRGHGGGRARTARAHGARLQRRQLAPLAILAGCVGGAALAPFCPKALTVPLAYAAVCGGWGVVATVRHRDPWLLAVGPAAMVMHIGWAVGFVQAGLEGRGGPGAPAAVHA